MKELENLIIEKIPHYFNGKSINKTFGLYSYNTYYFIGTSMSKGAESYPDNGVIGSFLIPNMLLKKINNSVEHSQIIRTSVNLILSQNNLSKPRHIRRLEKHAIIGNFDYVIFYFGLVHELPEIEANFLENLIKNIRDLCLRNLNADNPKRYLYI